MNIRVVTNKSEWNAFYNRVGSPSFHHSWEWGEFQKLCNNDIERVGLYHNNNLVAIALIVKVRSKRGKYLFIPHGPLFDILQDRLTQKIFSQQFKSIGTQLAEFHRYLTNMARSEGFWFIRLRLPWLAMTIM